MESWRDEKKEQDTYITVSSHLTKRCHIFATLKQTLLTVQIHSAAFQHRVTCQNPNYSVYTYIWTRFDNCALSLNSSGMFKRMVIAGLKQTENKSGSQNQLNRCRQPCREFWESGLVVGLFRCWAIIATICSAACFYPGPFSPRPPLLAALSVSAYHRDWRDMWSTGLHYGKVWLRYPCGITVIWPKNHHGLTNALTCTCTRPYTHRHIQRPTPGLISKFSTAPKILL